MTVVSIEGDQFFIDGRPTYPGRSFNGARVEGLLLNSRMVQAIFDDLNPKTRERWRYPDGPWDAERNSREFIAAMPSWKAHGLSAFTVNLQGGSPEGYSETQPWHNSAFDAEGQLRSNYRQRLEAILERANELSLVVILGLFYFGQDQQLRDEAAVITATDSLTDWLLEKRYTHVLIEIANEVDVGLYSHPILRVSRCHELIERVQRRSTGLPTPAGRLLVSTSMRGGTLPPHRIVSCADFLLLHGNRVVSAGRIRRMVQACRALKSYRGQPILFNEDDHMDFEAGENHFFAAVGEYAGWGYFDYRMSADEGFADGYQSVPVDWRISSPRKRGFFALLTQITGVQPGG